MCPSDVWKTFRLCHQYLVAEKSTFFIFALCATVMIVNSVAVL
jgi:hypothetical protein